MAIFWIIVVIGTLLVFWLIGSKFWFFFVLWLALMFWFSARPSYRQNVWVNYIFVIGVVLAIAFFVAQFVR